VSGDDELSGHLKRERPEYRHELRELRESESGRGTVLRRLR
jgi:hypothetical protein